MRILIVEDDETLRTGLMQALGRSGYMAVTASDGVEADLLLTTESFALVLLDLGLPHRDGLGLLTRLRNGNHLNRKVPVIVLSARDSLEERVRGLDGGADDYLAKPFDLRELIARIRALLRNSRSEWLQIGQLRWNWETQTALSRATLLALTTSESKLLDALLRRTGKIVPRDSLAALIGHGRGASEGSMNVCMHRLRRRLEGTDVEIQTVRGLGYVIAEKV